MNGFSSYDDLLEVVKQRGDDYRTLGHGPDGSPIVAVEAGGDLDPALLVTAGAHATEHAGVQAAVTLIDELETDHRVFVVPTRDPVGLNGYEYALETALDNDVSIGSFDDLTDVLRAEAEVVHDSEEMLLALVGDIGFATREPTTDQSSCLALMNALKEHAADPGSNLLTPFKGRRIYVPAGHPNVEETGNFRRAYTFVISPQGELMHLNRFFDRTWAPVETRCVRNLMAEIEPALTLDLHESSRQGSRYHISLRPTRTSEEDKWEARAASAVVDAVRDAGITLTTDEDIFGGSLDVVGHSSDKEEVQDSDANNQFYSKSERGAYWVDPNVTDQPRRGEGLNAVDYAAENYGLAYTTETGMHGTFENRVQAAVTSVQTAVDELATNYW